MRIVIPDNTIIAGMMGLSNSVADIKIPDSGDAGHAAKALSFAGACRGDQGQTFPRLFPPYPHRGTGGSPANGLSGVD
jgi:hypothetical protein